jgi:hypothetical protein
MYYLKFQPDDPGLLVTRYAEITASDFEDAVKVMVEKLGDWMCLPLRPSTLVTLCSADPKNPGKETPIAYLNVKKGFPLKLSSQHPLESKVQEDGRLRVLFNEYGFTPAYKWGREYYSFGFESFKTFEEAKAYIEKKKFVVKSEGNIQVLHDLIDELINDTPALRRLVAATTNGFPATICLHVETPESISTILGETGKPSWFGVTDTGTKPDHDRLFLDIPGINYQIKKGTFYKSQQIIEDLVQERREEIRKVMHSELDLVLSSSDVKKPVKFVIGMRGLNVEIDEFYTFEEFFSTNVPPNTSWDVVEVENEDDVEAFIAAKNRYLRAAWTTNQTEKDRKENGRIMVKAEAEMARLRKN